MKKKTLALLLSLVLVFGVIAGGTIAWLTAQSGKVTNTFVASELGSVTVTENTGDEYMVVPGGTITKDPVLNFKRTNADKSVAAYVFLKVEAANWEYDADTRTYTLKDGTNEAMHWVLADGWTAVPGVNNVYYKEVAAGAELTNIPIIKDNKIYVSGTTVTQTNIGDISSKATLSFQGFAIQKDYVSNTVKGAWDVVSAS